MLNPVDFVHKNFLLYGILVFKFMVNLAWIWRKQGATVSKTQQRAAACKLTIQKYFDGSDFKKLHHMRATVFIAETNSEMEHKCTLLCLLTTSPAFRIWRPLNYKSLIFL